MRFFPLLTSLPVLAALSGAGCANFTPEKTADQPEAPAATASAATGATPQTGAAGPAEKPESAPQPADAVDDGLRLPDMLGLPSDQEVNRSAPEPGAESSAEIIARPPAEP